MGGYFSAILLFSLRMLKNFQFYIAATDKTAVETVQLSLTDQKCVDVTSIFVSVAKSQITVEFK